MKNKTTESKKIDSKTIIGISIIILIVGIGFSFECPPKSARYIIYFLTALVFFFLLPKSVASATFSLNIKPISFKIFGGAAVFCFLSYIDPIQDSICNSVSVKVFIHGSKGKMDKVLSDGHLVMNIVGKGLQDIPIDKNGTATFDNLNIGDKVMFRIEFSEPFQLNPPDSVYVINSNREISLEVRLLGIDKVFGKTLYNDNPLKDVIVSTEGINDTTNTLGDFEIRIPDSLQKQQYQVWFSKEGYKSVPVIAYPETREPLNIIMEKVK